MTPADPRVLAAIAELANALQTVTLGTDQLRRELRAHVQDADILREAVSRAMAALHSIRKGVGS